MVLKCVPQSGAISAKYIHTYGIQLGSLVPTWRTPSNKIRDIHFTLPWQARRIVVAAHFEKVRNRSEEKPYDGGWKLRLIVLGMQLVQDMERATRANQCNGCQHPEPNRAVLRAPTPSTNV